MELQDYLRVLRAHWVGITAIVVATLLATALYTFTRTPVYSANSTGFVTTGAAETRVLSTVNTQVAISRATSYVALATSRVVAQRVIDNLGLSTRSVDLVKQITWYSRRRRCCLRSLPTGRRPKRHSSLPTRG